jgi:1,4-dihydroxy-2-naphthoyl-CoA synthase
MNLTDDDGDNRLQNTRLAYMTEEATEGRNAFLEKRKNGCHKLVCFLEVVMVNTIGV